MGQPSNDYDRGVAAGEIAARLAGHDEHFASINGSLGDLAGEMRGVKLALQRLADRAAADRATARAAATAARELDEARRNAADAKWLPMSRLLLAALILLALAAVAAVVVAVVYATHH